MQNLRVKAIAITVALLACASFAYATDLSGYLTVDDAFNAYLSTNESVLGTPLVSGNTWTLEYGFSTTLTPGTTYYLQVNGRDLYQIVAGFTGIFSLSDSGFKFANNGQALTTNANSGEWRVWLNGFGNTPGQVDVVNFDWKPYGYIHPHIPDATPWIWTNYGYDLSPGTGQSLERYFTTKITPVPEPISSSLFLLGAGALGLKLFRRKKA